MKSAKGKLIPGFENYAVYEDGTVINTETGETLKPYNSKGYLRVDLGGQGRHKGQFSVHRLVAEAFIKNPYHRKQINHIDGNKTNNHVSNLEWCNNSYNYGYAVCMQRVKQGIINPRAADPGALQPVPGAGKRHPGQRIRQPGRRARDPREAPAAAWEQLTGGGS